MYSSIYLHRVPHYNTDAFVRILDAAGKLYCEHGAVACRLYAPKNMAAKYDCLPFGDVITIAEHEHFFIEVNEFHDLAHHDLVMAKVDADPRIHQLYEDLKVIVDVSCIVRGEFEQIFRHDEQMTRGQKTENRKQRTEPRDLGRSISDL